MKSRLRDGIEPGFDAIEICLFEILTQGIRLQNGICNKQWPTRPAQSRCSLLARIAAVHFLKAAAHLIWAISCMHRIHHHMMTSIERETYLRTTVNLDDELLAKASNLTGFSERGVLLKEALKALVERETARRLAQLGGTEPNLEVAPRRRPA